MVRGGSDDDDDDDDSDDDDVVVVVDDDGAAIVEVDAEIVEVVSVELGSCCCEVLRGSGSDVVVEVEEGR